MSQYGLKNFLRIAKANIEPDTTTFAGFQQFLVNWFCEKFETTPNDYRLQELTLEELVVLWQQQRLRADPSIYDAELEGKGADNDYEKWLREEMGEDYVTEEENVAEMVKYEDDQKQKRKQRDEALRREIEELPDKISTDFSKLHQDE